MILLDRVWIINYIMEPVNPVAPPRKKRASQVVEYGCRSSSASTIMVESSCEKQSKPRKSVPSSVFDLDAFSDQLIVNVWLI